jgi:membrane associated rhomboid family serine protease
MGMMESSDFGWTEIRHFQHLGDAQQHALVLIAMSINCMLVRRPWGIGLMVALPDAARAESELDAYDEENRPRAEPAPGVPIGELVNGVLIAASLVVLSQMATEGWYFASDWMSSGASVAGKVVSGEWWRAFTALGLHGDLGHLLSNLIFGGALGLLVAQALGSGLGWLAIVLSGGIGNVVNAFYQLPGHSSIGASTAVFGALGIAAMIAGLRRTSRGPGLRRWAPFGAGIMLLAFMGFSGENTDIGAHIAGFGAGAVLGAAIWFARNLIPRGRRAQLVYGLSAAGLFVGSWLIAL